MILQFVINSIYLSNVKVCAGVKIARQELSGAALSPLSKDNKRTCSCPEPCTSSKSGRMFYTYPDANLRFCPGINRNSIQFEKLYHSRVTIEQTIFQLKSSLGHDTLFSRDHISLFSDFLLSAICMLLIFILSFAILKSQKSITYKKLQKLKKLIAWTWFQLLKICIFYSI